MMENRRAAGAKEAQEPKYFHQLDWADLQERRDILEEAQTWLESNVPTQSADAREWLRGIDHSLQQRFGSWVCGWQWGTSGGGIVTSWCCPSHSLHQGEEARNISTALREWCERIDQLARLFQELEFEYRALPLEVHLEHATARVVALVIELTGCNESWYYSFALITRWYFEHLGLQVSPDLLEQVISGYFESWTEPSAELMEAACRDLGKLAQHLRPSRDDLEVWLQTRERAFSLPLPPPPPPAQACDGHRAYILGPEWRRDSRRASRMLAALERCRHDSNQQVVLSFQLLAQWQSLVLDQPEPALRTTWAYAKGGREAYAPQHLQQLDNCLKQALGHESPALRAARVYLDVCFFHPFSDGNARAARLALDFVLTKAGLWLCVPEPIFCLSRSVSDETGARSLAELIDRLSAPRNQDP